MSIDVNTDDLAAFSAEFFNPQADKPAEENTEVVADVLEDSTAEAEAEALGDDTPAPEATEAEGEADEEGDKLEKVEPKKKQTFQERINQKTEETRLARDEAAREKAARIALEEKLAALEAGRVDKPVVKKVEKKEPAPDDVDGDGNPVYPLGEFDPKFATDFIKHRLDVERQERLEQEKVEKEQAKAAAQQEQALAEWNEKLVPAQERYPDFQERGQDLIEAFSGLDEQYGDYLVSTIMAMDAGPDVLYYLSTNLDEASKIVSMGAAKATLALGRIEAKFDTAAEEPKPRISSAPPPPPANKGSTASKPTIAPDTDDLAAFKEMFFKSR